LPRIHWLESGTRSEESVISVQIKAINVAVLFVEDMKKSTEFYRDLLGMKVNFDAPDSGGFDLESGMLILLDKTGARDLLDDQSVAGSPVVAVNSQLVSFVDDVDHIYAELSEKGVTFIRPPEDRDWGLRTAHFRDPDGNVWEIAQPVQRASESSTSAP
jgi:catechol 2,3-dioxygenase-like lactoylglutathione lyase family enzyme